MRARRPAELAGSWYAADAAELADAVDACVAKARTAYSRVLDSVNGTPQAIVAPHAGLAFSGVTAAAAYALLLDRLGTVDTFLVFGACHRLRLRRPAVWTRGAWETPIGDIEIDEALADALLEHGVGGGDAQAHAGDNAIELQTPFLRRLFPGAAMVPVAMGAFPDSGGIGRIAARAAAAHGGRVVAVASTDLTHYGRAFGVMPAGTGAAALAWIRENDSRFLSAVTRLALEEIVPVVERDGSACGAGAVAAAAGWSAERGAVAGRVLAWTNSHEVMPRGGAEHVVGYASAVFA